MVDRNGLKQIESYVPLANMFQYVSHLRSVSKGRAQYTMTLKKYDYIPASVEKEITAKFAGKVLADDE